MRNFGPEVTLDNPAFIHETALVYGKVFIGETPTSLGTLPADLSRILNKPEPTEERVYIRADRTVRYGDFMAVMNILQGNGFFQVALINEEL